MKAAAGANAALIQSVKVFGALNLLGLGVSLATGSHKHLDIIGTGAFAVVAWATRGQDLRSWLSAGVVGLWSARLASFLLYRALQMGHDARLDVTLSTVGGMLGFWGVSLAWGILTALPHTLGTSCRDRPKFGVGAVAALLLCAIGLYWEIGSDLQKWWFKADPANKGQFCSVGLWSLSQHPNYFGNLCIWTGVFLLNATPLTRAGPARLLLAALGPLSLAGLFYGQATGVITNSAQLAAAKYSGDAAFTEYVNSVPLIVPVPKFL